MRTRTTTNTLRESTGHCEKCSGQHSRGVSGNQEGRKERNTWPLNHRWIEGQDHRCKDYRNLYS